MKMGSNCYAGRIIVGGGGLDRSLNWNTPCPVPTECVLPTKVPLFFCAAHFAAVMDTLYVTFDRLGMIDHSIVGKGPDEFDELTDRLRE